MLHSIIDCFYNSLSRTSKSHFLHITLYNMGIILSEESPKGFLISALINKPVMHKLYFPLYICSVGQTTFQSISPWLSFWKKIYVTRSGMFFTLVHSRGIYHAERARRSCRNLPGVIGKASDLVTSMYIQITFYKEYPIGHIRSCI